VTVSPVHLRQRTQETYVQDTWRRISFVGGEVVTC